MQTERRDGHHEDAHVDSPPMSARPEVTRGERFPRSLNALEYQVIRTILIDGAPGVAELRVQLDSAQVSAQ